MALASTGQGTSGLADTSLGGMVVALAGTVYATPDARLGTETIDFGPLHIGQSATRSVDVTNIVSGTLTDGLTGALSPNSVGPFSGSGSTGGGLPAGSSTAFSFTFAGGDAIGTYGGSLPFAFVSHDTAQPDAPALGDTVIDFVAIVEDYAIAQVVEVSGTPPLVQIGDDYTLNLGQVGLGAGPVTVQLGVENAAEPFADLLEGGFTSSGDAEIALTGFSAFAGLAAGATHGGLDVTLNTGAIGVFSQHGTLVSTGYNASGYSGALTPEVITITGTVDAEAAATLDTPGRLVLPNQRMGAAP